MNPKSFFFPAIIKARNMARLSSTPVGSYVVYHVGERAYLGLLVEGHEVGDGRRLGPVVGKLVLNC